MMAKGLQEDLQGKIEENFDGKGLREGSRRGSIALVSCGVL